MFIYLPPKTLINYLLQIHSYEFTYNTMEGGDNVLVIPVIGLPKSGVTTAIQCVDEAAFTNAGYSLVKVTMPKLEFHSIGSPDFMSLNHPNTWLETNNIRAVQISQATTVAVAKAKPQSIVLVERSADYIAHVHSQSVYAQQWASQCELETHRAMVSLLLKPGAFGYISLRPNPDVVPGGYANEFNARSRVHAYDRNINLWAGCATYHDLYVKEIIEGGTRVEELDLPNKKSQINKLMVKAIDSLLKSKNNVINARLPNMSDSAFSVPIPPTMTLKPSYHKDFLQYKVTFKPIIDPGDRALSIFEKKAHKGPLEKDNYKSLHSFKKIEDIFRNPADPAIANMTRRTVDDPDSVPEGDTDFSEDENENPIEDGRKITVQAEVHRDPEQSSSPDTSNNRPDFVDDGTQAATAPGSSTQSSSKTMSSSLKGSAPPQSASQSRLKLPQGVARNNAALAKDIEARKASVSALKRKAKIRNDSDDDSEDDFVNDKKKKPHPGHMSQTVDRTRPGPQFPKAQQEKIDKVRAMKQAAKLTPVQSNVTTFFKPKTLGTRHDLTKPHTCTSASFIEADDHEPADITNRKTSTPRTQKQGVDPPYERRRSPDFSVTNQSAAEDLALAAPIAEEEIRKIQAAYDESIQKNKTNKQVSKKAPAKSKARSTKTSPNSANKKVTKKNPKVPAMTTAKPSPKQTRARAKANANKDLVVPPPPNDQTMTEAVHRALEDTAMDTNQIRDGELADHANIVDNVQHDGVDDLIDRRLEEYAQENAEKFDNLSLSESEMNDATEITDETPEEEVKNDDN